MKKDDQNLEALEVKLSYQEYALEALNQQVIKLNSILETQSTQLRSLVERIKTLENNENHSNTTAITPPPHY